MRKTHCAFVFFITAALTLCFHGNFLWAVQGEQSPPKVGRVAIHRINVFDPEKPGENKPPYTWINELHILTKENVIHRELLLAPGDSLDPYLVENTERNLRSYPFLRSADIVQHPKSDGTVDLDLTTQDTWTTDFFPTFSLGAGEHKTGILLEERNFLGLGKTVGLSYFDSSDRFGREIQYYDPRVWGTRLAARISHSNFDDGYITDAFIGIPVYSLLAPISMDVSGHHSAISDEPIYAGGREIDRISKERRSWEFAGGHTLKATSRRALRSTYGYSVVKERFGASTSTVAFAVPQTRELRMVKLALSYQEAKYIKENQVNIFERYEDFNLGFEAQFRLAYSPSSLGATNDELLPKLTSRLGKSFGLGKFLIGGGDFYCVYDSKNLTQIVQAANVAYYHKNWLHPNNTLAVHAEMATVLRLRPGSQLLLGGDSGLRGYHFDAFSGNRSALVNAESRFYWVEDWLHIVSIAPAAFWDAGYVWFEGKRWKLSDFKHDVGVGLRLGFTRSASASVVRLDLSYALNREGTSKNRLVFSVGAQHAFGGGYNSLKKVTMD